MKELDLPDVIKTKIGLIKFDIHELEYLTSCFLTAGISSFYMGTELNNSLISTLCCITGTTALAVSACQIEKIQEKKREIEEYNKSNTHLEKHKVK